MKEWIWVDNFWKGIRRKGGEDVDFTDPTVGPYKPRLIAERRIVKKEKIRERVKKEGD